MQRERMLFSFRSKDKLTAIADELQNEALVVDCDLAADRSIELIGIQTIEKFEKINILVNNAAVERNEPAHRQQLKRLMKHFS